MALSLLAPNFAVARPRTTDQRNPDMNLLVLARGLPAAVLLTSLAACGGGGTSAAAQTPQALAMNPVGSAAKSGDVPTPSLRCAP